LNVSLHCPTMLKRLWAEDCASQMVEFAVSLPLLIVFVVGIFDFSGAYTLKHKLANAARDAARAAAADPATDLGNGAGIPVSVSDAFQVVDNDLIAEKINDCGINPSSGAKAALTWTYTATAAGPPPCRLILTINRGYPFTEAAGGTTVHVIATQVTIQYDYNWHFNTVITVLVPTAGYGNKLTFQTSAVALNEN
jgi:Flp pilus assembly protein TadG